MIPFPEPRIGVGSGAMADSRGQLRQESMPGGSAPIADRAKRQPHLSSDAPSVNTPRTSAAGRDGAWQPGQCIGAALANEELAEPRRAARGLTGVRDGCIILIS